MATRIQLSIVAYGVALVTTLVVVAACNAQSVLNASDYSSAPLINSQGKAYRVVRGAAYEVQGSQLVFRTQLYDPDFYAKNYRQEKGIIYRYVDADHKYPVLTSMNEGFEGASRLPELIGPARGWNSFTLQGPATPTVDDYVRLRKVILEQGGDFVDNRIEPSAATVHGGARSLRAYAYPSSWRLDVSKASLETVLLHFRKGDDFWFAGWFYIANGTPVGILDLESSYLPEYPGLRILLSDTLQPRVELKWADKPTYHVAPASAVLARNRWHYIRLHAYLSDGADGRVEMWLNGTQILNVTGQTLPLPDSVYDRLEIGVTANQSGTAELFVDDMRFDRTPLF